MGLETVSARRVRHPRLGTEGAAAGIVPARRRRADDAGFTPAEIIIGVILVGILATGVTIKAIQLMDRARDSAAQKTLRAADVAAQAAFSVMLPGGQSNFASAAIQDGAVDHKKTGAKAYSTDADTKVIKAIQDQEPGLSIKSFGITADALKGMASDGQVWIEVNNIKISLSAAVTAFSGANPNGHTARTTSLAKDLSIRPGEMIRMGIVAASGSTFCVITVADSSDGTISGDGWQAVEELPTLNGHGADCGADLSEADSADGEFKEMPGTPGTDPNLSQPIAAAALKSGKEVEYVK